MIFVGIGSNLESHNGKSPKNNCIEAISRLNQYNVQTYKSSPFYETEPISDESQPWYINSVLAVKTKLNPFQLLDTLLKIELEMGRYRTFQNAPRVIDLDLLTYDNQIIGEEHLTLPHPRMHKRAFVLRPLVEIAPEWLHPVTGINITTMIDNLDPNQIVRLVKSEACVF